MPYAEVSLPIGRSSVSHPATAPETLSRLLLPGARAGAVIDEGLHGLDGMCAGRTIAALRKLFGPHWTKVQWGPAGVGASVGPIGQVSRTAISRFREETT